MFAAIQNNTTHNSSPHSQPFWRFASHIFTQMSNRLALHLQQNRDNVVQVHGFPYKYLHLNCTPQLFCWTKQINGFIKYTRNKYYCCFPSNKSIWLNRNRKMSYQYKLPYCKLCLETTDELIGILSDEGMHLNIDSTLSQHFCFKFEVRLLKIFVGPEWKRESAGRDTAVIDCVGKFF